jgi:hypothetical protein
MSGRRGEGGHAIRVYIYTSSWLVGILFFCMCVSYLVLVYNRVRKLREICFHVCQVDVGKVGTRINLYTGSALGYNCVGEANLGRYS